MNPTLDLHTEFAPAERANASILQRQAENFSGPSFLSIVLDNIPSLVLILNSQRQIVYANRTTLLTLGAENPESVMGIRTGEALNCIHAFEHNGCGTTRFCRECGAVLSILSALQGKGSVEECRILRKEDHHFGALDLRVWSQPITYNSEQFVLFVATDIEHEKRRAAMERIFFHDILNTAASIQVAIEMVDRASEGKSRRFSSMALHGINQLTEEINMQRDLSKAENNELVVNLEAFNSTALVEELISLNTSQAENGAGVLQLAPDSISVDVNSDRVLLRRVLSNMVKNAQEASQPDHEILLGCRETGKEIEFWVHSQPYIPTDIQAQIFQRSFSTKGRDRGLGTYSIKLLTENYLHGKAGFTSKPEEGTTFYIRLPLNKQ